jgi:hypothetical protein
MATEQPSTSITDAIQTLFKDSRADNRFGRLQTDLEANNTVAAVKLDLDDPVATGEFLSLIMAELHALHDAAIVLASVLDRERS